MEQPNDITLPLDVQNGAGEWEEGTSRNEFITANLGNSYSKPRKVSEKIVKINEKEYEIRIKCKLSDLTEANMQKLKLVSATPCANVSELTEVYEAWSRFRNNCDMYKNNAEYFKKENSKNIMIMRDLNNIINRNINADGNGGANNPTNGNDTNLAENFGNLNLTLQLMEEEIIRHDF